MLYCNIYEIFVFCIITDVLLLFAYWVIGRLLQPIIALYFEYEIVPGGLDLSYFENTVDPDQLASVEAI